MCQVPALNVTALEQSIYHWASQQLRQKGKHVTFSNQSVLQIFLKSDIFVALKEFIAWVLISKAEITMSSWNFVIEPFVKWASVDLFPHKIWGRIKF